MEYVSNLNMGLYKKHHIFIARCFAVFFALNTTVSFGACLSIVDNGAPEMTSSCHHADDSSDSGIFELSKCCTHCLLISVSIEYDDFNDIASLQSYALHQYRTITHSLAPLLRPPINSFS